MKREPERVHSGSVVRVVVIDYALLSGAQQTAIRRRLEALFGEVTADVFEEERIVVDTDDGVALCLLGDPENALFAALGLRERLRGDTLAGSGPSAFRIGITFCPVKVETTRDGRSRLASDDRRQAHEVLSAARPGQIVASESFFGATARGAPGYAQLFRRLESVAGGRTMDNQPVYEVMTPGQGANTTRTGNAAPPDSPSTELIAYHTGWERAELTAAAVALAPYVGPRARALVKEAAERATSVTHLYHLLAEAIPTEQDREEFRRVQGLV
jgi:hypothetical protein